MDGVCGRVIKGRGSCEGVGGMESERRHSKWDMMKYMYWVLRKKRLKIKYMLICHKFLSMNRWGPTPKEHITLYNITKKISNTFLNIFLFSFNSPQLLATSATPNTGLTPRHIANQTPHPLCTTFSHHHTRCNSCYTTLSTSYKRTPTFCPHVA